MSRVKIRCPSCAVNGFIEISEDYLKNVARGLLAINIPEGTICEHTFITYVDRNLKVRDYFIADFKIEIPDLAPPEEIEDKKIPSKDIINLDLIKLNFSGLLLTYILKSIFSKQKIVIISDQDFLYEHIHNFFDYITRDTFKAEIELINRENYKKNKKKYQDCMVFQGNAIINNIEKIIDVKKLKVEKYFIQSFLSEHDLSYSYIMLKNEIRKSYQLSTSIVDYANEQKIEKIDVKVIVDFLIEKFNLRLQKTYLNFIIDILKYYFEVTVSETSDASGFLKLI